MWVTAVLRMQVCKRSQAQSGRPKRTMRVTKKVMSRLDCKHCNVVRIIRRSSRTNRWPWRTSQGENGYIYAQDTYIRYALTVLRMCDLNGSHVTVPNTTNYYTLHEHVHMHIYISDGCRSE